MISMRIVELTASANSINLFLIFIGKCSSLALCNFMKCSEGQKCKLERNSGNVTCVCKDIYECPFEYKPICGSDHTTYASKCIMGMNSCVKKTEVSMLSAGACPKGKSPSSNIPHLIIELMDFQIRFIKC